MAEDSTKANWFLVAQFFLFGCYGVSFALGPAISRPPWFVIVSCVVAAVGLTIFAASLLAHRTVNRTPMVRVSALPDVNRKLVDVGVYSLVRHPIYLGAMLAFFGCALAFGNYLTLLVTILLTVFVNIKARYEEKLLLTVFPDYQQYMARTGRLLPRL